jgi:hypothetical protein
MQLKCSLNLLNRKQKADLNISKIYRFEFGSTAKNLSKLTGA